MFILPVIAVVTSIFFFSQQVFSSAKLAPLKAIDDELWVRSDIKPLIPIPDNREVLDTKNHSQNANPKKKRPSVGKSIPSTLQPRQWYRRLTKEDPSRIRNLPRYVLFLSQLPKLEQELPQMMKIDADRFNRLSWIKTIDQSELTAIIKLNQWQEGKPFSTQYPNHFRSIDKLMELTGTQYALQEIPGKNRWNLYIRTQNSMDELKPIALLKSPLKGSLAEPEFQNWLVEKLGFDGIILDQVNDYLLIAKYRPYQEFGQGSTVKNSSELYFISSELADVSALFQIMHHDEDLAVGKLLVSRPQSHKIDPGTKILLGRS